MYYEIHTKDDDIEAGYPEYSDIVKNKEDLIEASKKVIDYGLPLHRVSVMECMEDDEIDEFESQYDDLGTLEEVLEYIK